MFFRVSWLLVILPCFLVVVLTWHDGGINPGSRFAALEAVVGDHSFRIDPYLSWAGPDWSQTPDGAYYSNKAPGPLFLGLPLYALMRTVEQLTDRSVEKVPRSLQVAEQGVQKVSESPSARVSPPSVFQKLVFSLFMQWLPFAILWLVLLGWLQQRQISPEAQLFFSLAFLLGNTASLFMSTYFGHGLAALLLGVYFYALIKQKWFLSGMAASWLLLTDYGAWSLLPLLPIFIYQSGARDRRAWTRVCLGAAPAISLWVWYHTTCFGAFWRTAHSFQNPVFLSSKAEVLGEFSGLPHPSVFFELMAGFRRGLLWTQPWVLVILGLVAWGSRYGRWLHKDQGSPFDSSFRLLRNLNIFCFIFLLLMNASFVGWHGGRSPGPRYLSPVLPYFGVLAGLLYDRLPERGGRLIRGLLWGSLLPSLLLWGCVTVAHPLLAEDKSLWLELWNEFQRYGFSHGWFQRLILVLAGLTVLSALFLRGQKRNGTVPSQASSSNA